MAGQTIIRMVPAQTVVREAGGQQTIVRPAQQTTVTVEVDGSTTLSPPASTTLTVRQGSTVIRPARSTVIKTTAISGTDGVDGQDGAPGPPGPQGPPGSGSGGTGEVHVQSFPATVWTITHGLGYYPAVNTFDTTGDEIEGDVKHPSLNQVVITFSALVSGVTYLS